MINYSHHKAFVNKNYTAHSLTQTSASRNFSSFETTKNSSHIESSWICILLNRWIPTTSSGVNSSIDLIRRSSSPCIMIVLPSATIRSRFFCT